MKKIILLLSILLTSFCFGQHLISQEQISLEVQSFYQHPSYTLLSDIIKSMDADSTFLSEEHYPPFIGFLTVAFSKYHEKYEDFKEIAEGLRFKGSLILYCLKLSGIKDTILNWPGHDASINDMHWGGFFASGDSRYLQRLVSEMQYCGDRDSLMLFPTGATAKWSLCANARNYPEVKQYLEHASETADSALKPQIIESLNSTPNELRNEMNDGIKQFSNNIPKRLAKIFFWK